MRLQKLIDAVRDTLSKKRFSHSIGVMDEAAKLASRWNYNPLDAQIAGICHDITKELDNHQQLMLCKKFDIILDEVELTDYKLLHPISGAALAQHQFGIDNPDIISAIRWHTTGRANMSLLDKIIYLADYIEPSRTSDEAIILRSIAYDNLDAALLRAFDFSICELVARRKLIHINTLEARNFLLRT